MFIFLTTTHTKLTRLFKPALQSTPIHATNFKMVQTARMASAGGMHSNHHPLNPLHPSSLPSLAPRLLRNTDAAGTGFNANNGRFTRNRGSLCNEGRHEGRQFTTDVHTNHSPPNAPTAGRTETTAAAAGVRLPRIGYGVRPDTRRVEKSKPI